MTDRTDGTHGLLRKLPLDVLDVPPRVPQVLRQHGFETLDDLAGGTDARLREARGLGIRGWLALAREMARLVVDEAYRQSLVERVARYDLDRLPAEVRTLPIEQLGLEPRACGALRRHGVATVADLLGMGERGLRSLRGVGPRTLAEIQGRINALREGRPLPSPGEGAEPIAPDLVDESAPVSVLLLPKRVTTALTRAGITQVGTLAGLSRRELVRLRGIGETGVAAIQEACRRYQSERDLHPGATRGLSQWLEDLIAPLPERERQVLALRYGLFGAEPQELAEIAARWRTTRQWISVLQGRAIRRARVRARMDRFQPLVQAVWSVVEEWGMIDATELASELRRARAIGMPEDADARIRLTRLLVQVTPRLQRLRGSIWTKVELAERVPQVAQRLVDVLHAAQRPLPLRTLVERVAASWPESSGGTSLEVLVRLALSTQPVFSRMPGGLYGLAQWRSARRLRARDYVYQALERHGRPVHYAELTRLVNELLPEGRRMPPTHVLTVVAGGEPFRRFDRGIYGLSHWRRQRETLDRLCCRVLEERGEPATLEEIVSQVQQQRRYPRRTVARALNEEPEILRYGRDRFGLGSWLATGATRGVVRTPAYGPRPSNLQAVRGLLIELLAGHVYDAGQVTAYLGRWRQRSQARRVIAYLHTLGWLGHEDGMWVATPLNQEWIQAGEREEVQLAALATADPAFAHSVVLTAAFAALTRRGPFRPGATVDGDSKRRSRPARGVPDRLEPTAAPGLAGPDGRRLACELLARRIQRRLGRSWEEAGPEALAQLQRLWLATDWFEPWLVPLLGDRYRTGMVAAGGDAAADAAAHAPTRHRAAMADAWRLVVRDVWPNRPVHLPIPWLETPATAWVVVADTVASRQGKAVHWGALMEWWKARGLDFADPVAVEAELFALGVWPGWVGERLHLFMPYRLVGDDQALAERLGLPPDDPLGAAAQLLDRAGVLVSNPTAWEEQLHRAEWQAASPSAV